MDQKSFLERYNVSEEQFKITGLDWSTLVLIAKHHHGATAELQAAGRYLADRLELLDKVHSLKVRIKEPEHLIAKIIRKKLSNEALECTLANYATHITDLIGLRVLHLFKSDWRDIHEFITKTWDLHEPPIAYVRAVDHHELIDGFKDARCEVREHPFGYRSIHYLVEVKPAKQIHFAELQVRTIFEEGWSEIDHRVRYPYHSDNLYLSNLLTILNRLAGSADEMGTFTQALSAYIIDQSRRQAENEHLLNEKEDSLAEAITKLEISESEKAALGRRVAELRKSTPSRPSDSSVTFPKASQMPAFFESPYMKVQKNCLQCGKEFTSDLFHVSAFSRCPECKDKPIFNFGVFLNK